MSTNTNVLSYDQAVNVIANMARSQGFYGRLLRDIQDDPDAEAYLRNVLQTAKPKDAVDLCIALEG